MSDRCKHPKPLAHPPKAEEMRSIWFGDSCDEWSVSDPGLPHFVEYVPKAQLSEATQERERLKWKLSQFSVYGTDGCISCECGRVSLFIANEECMRCDPAGYEIPAALSPEAKDGEE